MQPYLIPRSSTTIIVSESYTLVTLVPNLERRAYGCPRPEKNLKGIMNECQSNSLTITRFKRSHDCKYRSKSIYSGRKSVDFSLKGRICMYRAKENGNNQVSLAEAVPNEIVT